MERQIMFRAWDEENKKMYLPDFPFIGAGSGARDIAITLDGRVITPNSYGFYVPPEQPIGKLIIEQWTGLLDKHGTRIFEGDVVKLDDNPDVAKGTEFYSHDDVSHHEVYWDDKRACFWDRRIEDGDSGACHADGDISFITEGVVIGSIHTSPDLIK